jgi:hypothetical protein
MLIGICRTESNKTNPEDILPTYSLSLEEEVRRQSHEKSTRFGRA